MVSEIFQNSNFFSTTLKICFITSIFLFAELFSSQPKSEKKLLSGNKHLICLPSKAFWMWNVLRRKHRTKKVGICWNQNKKKLFKIKVICIWKYCFLRSIRICNTLFRSLIQRHFKYVIYSEIIFLVDNSANEN